MKSKLYVWAWVVVLTIGLAQAQLLPVKYESQAGVNLILGSQNPFWFHANQYGEVPTRGSFLTFKQSLSKTYQTDSTGQFKNKWIGWSAGIRGVLNLGRNSEALFPELYANLRIWQVEIGIGRRRESVGMVEPGLGVGNYSFATNAFPIPKIQIRSLGFVPVPYTKGWLAVKFNYADGRLGGAPTTAFTQKVYLPETYFHQKTLYARLGKPTANWNVYGGFCHQAIWGGEAIYTNGALGTDKWQTYKAAIQAVSWSSSRIGNHVANIDIGFTYQNDKRKLTFYRQTLIEDGSLVKDFSSIRDGIQGVVIEPKQVKQQPIMIKKYVVEWVYTYYQGGSEFVFALDGPNGRDNYFNHYIYAAGWTYKGRTIGTPILATTNLLKPTLQADETIGNNRLTMLHVGLQGQAYNHYDFVLKTSLSVNAGTYANVLKPQKFQLSTILELKRKTKLWNGAELVGMFATDLGGLYPNSAALYVGITKSGWLMKPKAK